MTKLILHFDINGTITPFDTTEPGTKLENANVIIAKNVYGKVNNNKWILNDNIYDENNSISYYNYLKQITKDYKTKSFIFTSPSEPGASLIHLIPLLIKSMDEFLFESFLRALITFHNAQIILRTFGLDADEVINYLKTNKSTSHIFNAIIQGTFNNDDETPTLLLETSEIIIGMDKINDLFAKSNYHMALKENYNYWNYNKRNKLAGKQLLGDSRYVQIFFDDNDCVNVINTINVYNIKVNTLDVMLNKNFYIDQINNILKLHTNLI